MASNSARNQVRTVALCALFAALSVAISPIKIPIGAVPVGIVHISIFMAAAFLGARKAAVSQAVFVLIGIMGVPIFAATGLPGPTGGFIVGYILCAFVTGAVIGKFGRSYPVLFIAMYAGWIVTYAVGIPWFMYVTGSELVPALLSCMLPFLPGDAVKTVLCAVLIRRLAPVISRYSHSG